MLHFRRTCQVIFLAFFIFLILASRANPSLRARVAMHSFLQVDPLLASTSLILTHSVSLFFLPAVILLAITVIFGRLFCGWICPLGTTFDVLDRLLIPRRFKRKTGDVTNLSRTKYLVLAAVILLSALGVGTAIWSDPLCLATQIFGALIIPAALLLPSLALDLFGKIESLHSTASSMKSSLIAMGILPSPEFDPLTIQTALLMFIVLAALFTLLLVQRRFWCRNLCPLGALLGLVARLRVVRHTTDETCKECGLCEKECRMAAFHAKGSLPHECVQCQTCISVCPTKSILLAWPRRSSGKRPTPLMLPSRRAFLFTSLAALASAAVLKLHSSLLRTQHRPLRPPGADDDDDVFLSKCQRCGECVNACPTTALQPSFLEAGIMGFGAPILVPSIGYCIHTCNVCGKVCPSQAIPYLPLPQKQKERMGTAFIDRSRCRPWTMGEECFSCEEVCPTKAVVLTPETTKVIVSDVQPESPQATFAEMEIRRPYVDKDKCTGCGFCEWKCRREVTDAIHVSRLPYGLFLSDYNK